MGPEDFAGGGIERIHGLRMPEDELFGATGLDDHGRAVAGLACVEGAPELLAGVFVEGNGDAAGPAAEADEALAIEQRMTGEAPHWGLGGVFGFEIVRPENLAAGGIEAEEISLCAESPHFAAADQRGAARAGGVAHGVGAVVAMLPDEGA